MTAHDARDPWLPITLNADELTLIAAAADRISAPEGAVIIREGVPGDEMFVLLEGELNVTVRGKTIDHLTPGMILGEMAMIDDRPRSATATAATDCLLFRIDRVQFQELVRRSPTFALRVMNIMSIRTRRLMEVEVNRQRMEEELAIGRRIQISLLPRGCPQAPGYEFAAGYRAAREVGGDLYDFIVPPGSPAQVHIVIADVTGKGVPAALYMAVARTLLHTFALQGHSPAEALRRVNQFIREDEATPLFLSAFYAVLDTDRHRLTYANAGHNPPILLRHTGELELLESNGILLGAFNGFAFEERSRVIDPGDYVIFFTDGITEARNAGGEFFDDGRLETVVAARLWSSAEELVAAIVAAVDEFSTGAPQADDFTVVVMRRL
jgi:serine phosphatase RsbU (regulator of sigma subunit)